LADQFDYEAAAMLLMYFSKLTLLAVGLGGTYNTARYNEQDIVTVHAPS
jgi:hypothetical protein